MKRVYSVLQKLKAHCKPQQIFHLRLHLQNMKGDLAMKNVQKWVAMVFILAGSLGTGSAMAASCGIDGYATMITINTGMSDCLAFEQQGTKEQVSCVVLDVIGAPIVAISYKGLAGGGNQSFNLASGEVQRLVHGTFTPQVGSQINFQNLGDGSFKVMCTAQPV